MANKTLLSRPNEHNMDFRVAVVVHILLLLLHSIIQNTTFLVLCTNIGVHKRESKKMVKKITITMDSFFRQRAVITHTRLISVFPRAAGIQILRALFIKKNRHEFGGCYDMKNCRIVLKITANVIS